jgi:3-isopropylmalate/(R)-2-methylmalate dehydratase small subunit
MTTFLRGQAWVHGHDVSTHATVPSKYLNLTDPKEVARHLTEGVDPDVGRKVAERRKAAEGVAAEE